MLRDVMADSTVGARFEMTSDVERRRTSDVERRRTHEAWQSTEGRTSGKDSRDCHGSRRDPSRSRWRPRHCRRCMLPDSKLAPVHVDFEVHEILAQQHWDETAGAVALRNHNDAASLDLPRTSGFPRRAVVIRK